MDKQEEMNQQDVPQTESCTEQESLEGVETSENESDSQEKDPIQKLEEEKAELEAKNKELQNQYLLARADLENYRKKMIKEKQEAFDYANANLLSDLLESLDNFDRALDAATNSTDVSTVVDGVSMIKNQLVSMLENKYNLVSYGIKGDAFDPNMHEAIGSMTGPVAEPVCSEVYLKGYKLKERIIRYAKVMVQKPDGTVPVEGATEKTEVKETSE